MRILTVIIPLLAVLAVSNFAAAEEESSFINDNKFLFQQWKSNYNKVYKTVDEELKAFETFLDNKSMIDKINNDPMSSWQATINQFSDLTPQEFREKILMRLPTPAGFSNSTTIRSNKPSRKLSSSAPSSFDWRSDSSVAAVTPVRDQGNVGTCWAFSTIENIEGQWALAGHDLTVLSPEFLVDCDGSSDEKHADCSVFGGWPYLAYQFIIDSQHGQVPSDAEWPYCSGTGNCYPCMLGPSKLCGPPPYYCDRTIQDKCTLGKYSAAATISSWKSVTSDEAEIANILYTQGPLSVLFDASQLQYYHSGIWTGSVNNSDNPLLSCSKTELNHAVLLVGYGSEDGVDYWIVKNSWGAKWGESGYFRIVRGQGKCGINTAVTTAIV